MVSTRGGDHELHLGQDISIGYLSHDAESIELYFQESLTFLAHTAEVDLAVTVDTDGWVTTDPTGRTSVAGVWAAGNVVDPRAQVITAAGAGSAAAIALNADLVEEDVRNAVRDLDHGLLPRPTAGANPKESS